ncbi:MAG: c-type cytochrome [Chitinophagaceae bacterium]|nr:c-type cytochrome [Chitinophagaceae bacterium]
MQKKSIVLLTLLGAFVTMWTIACSNQSSADNGPTEKDSTALVKRGEYLVMTTGCDDCHSPKRMGPMGPEIIPELRLSGFQENDILPPVDKAAVAKGWSLFAPGQTAAVGPWGVSYAANITSDATGIGNWSEAQFMKSIRKGLYKGLDEGRPLLPPMPWFVLKNMTDEDLKAMYYYLKTTKPVTNRVPGPQPLDVLK